MYSKEEYTLELVRLSARLRDFSRRNYSYSPEIFYTASLPLKSRSSANLSRNLSEVPSFRQKPSLFSDKTHLQRFFAQATRIQALLSQEQYQVGSENIENYKGESNELVVELVFDVN